jgi:secretion/DNA translocation related TadE-like protein
MRQRERGSVSVLSAAVLFLAAVLSLITVDLARVVRAEARAQTAADAAALAAAQEIALPSGRSPSEIAAEYAGRNGGTLVWCRCDTGGTEAVVDVSVEAALLFLEPDRSVERQARAVIEVPGGPP